MFVGIAEGGEEDGACGGRGSDTVVALMSGGGTLWVSLAAGWGL